MMDEYAVLKKHEKAVLHLRSLYQSLGYKKYKVSCFEEYSYYMDNKNFLTGRHIPTFTDLDGRLLALKPDVTLSIIKHSNATRTRGEKLYYLENVYRESASAASYREISQMGLEYLGATDSYAVMEVLFLASSSLAAFDSDYRLILGNMDFTLGVLASLSVPPPALPQLIAALAGKSQHELRAAGAQVGLSAEALDQLSLLAGLTGDYGSVLQAAQALAVTDDLQAILTEMQLYYLAAAEAGYADKLYLDFSLLDDVNYYNGIIISGYLSGVPRAVLSGGCYDQMMHKLGKQSDAIGFAIYLDEIAAVLQQKADYDVDAVLLYDDDVDYLALMTQVRALLKQGLSLLALKEKPADLHCRKLYRLTKESLEEVPQ